MGLKVAVQSAYRRLLTAKLANRLGMFLTAELSRYVLESGLTA